MNEAIDLLKTGYKDFMPNDDREATYNTTPTFSEALEYRMKRIKSLFR